MADPTAIIDHTAPVYAEQMGETWDDLSPRRKREWRALAFKIYELHAKNKIEGMKNCLETLDNVMTAPSTPKTWLRGVQEAKNALVAVSMAAANDLTTGATIPDEIPDDFDTPDPYVAL